MRYALIGCGRIAPFHITAARENGLELVAICDVVPAHMQELAESCGLMDVPRYTDYKEMVAAQRPQLAAIATESGSHAAIALWCIAQGVNLIIEKPIAMSMADADEIVRRSKEKGMMVCACHQNRFNLGVQQLRAALDAGRLGRLSHGAVNVRWQRDEEYYKQAAWRGTWAQDGGCLMNQCIHGIDLLRWLMGGDVTEVYGVTARRQHPYMQAEDIGMAVLRFGSGAVATVEGTTNIYPSNLEESLFVFGDSGTVKLGGMNASTVDVWKVAGEEAMAPAPEGAAENAVYGNGHACLYADVVQALAEGRRPYVDAQAGRDALELVLAIYKSAQSGRPVQLPLQNCSCAEFAGMFD